MSLDDAPLPSQRRVRQIELALACLLLGAMAVLSASDSATLAEAGLTVSFLVPGLLSLVALVSAGWTVYLLVWTERDRRIRDSWPRLGTLAVTGVIVSLAVTTLYFVVQTILVATVIDTGGGVMFGPILGTATGVALATLVCLRSVVGVLLADRGSIGSETPIR